jgi:hypothetical protein
MARSTKGSNQRPDTLMQDRTSANSTKFPCNARPDHTLGSKPAVRGMLSASPLHLNEPTSIAATLLTVFQDRAGHQKVASRRAGHKYLACGDTIATVDFLGLAGASTFCGTATGDPWVHGLQPLTPKISQSLLPRWVRGLSGRQSNGGLFGCIHGSGHLCKDRGHQRGIHR